MKRFFSLLALLVGMLTMGGYVHAQTTYEISNNSDTHPENKQKDPWTFVSKNTTFTIKADGNRSYGTASIKPALKYSKDKDYTLTIPDNLNIAKINFKGSAKESGKETYLTFEGKDYSDKQFTYSSSELVNSFDFDWPTDKKSITFKFNGKGETLLVITLTEAASDKLNAPTFSYDENEGKVTITANGAKEIRYTTDETEPSANVGTVYTEPFEASNITVKAIAISDGTKENSDVATYEVPAKLISTNVALTKVTIDGTTLADADLQTLLDNKSFTSTTSYSVTPVIKYTETTTKEYNNNKETTADEEKTATVDRGEDNFTTSFDVNGETYTITLPINKDVTVEAPTHVAVNGTVALSCTTEGVTLYYKIGDGEYQEYTRPFTILDEDAKITAKATLGEKETACEAFTVEAVKCKKDRTVLIYWDQERFDGFELKTKDNGDTYYENHEFVGKSGTDVEGFKLLLNKDGKNYQTAAAIDVNGTSYPTIKLSNKNGNILTIPENYKAVRMTLYSFINGSTSNTQIGWADVNGAQEYKNILMGAFNDVKDYTTNPDVRVYGFGEGVNEISFKNAGTQLGFVIALDLIDVAPSTTDITITNAKMATYCNTSAWTVPSDLEVYTAKYADNKVMLTQVEAGKVIKAGEGVVLYGEPKKYTVSLSSETGEELDNSLVGVTEDTQMNNEKTYVLVKGDNGKVCFGKLKNGQTVKAGKAYLTIEDASAAKTLSVDFGTTGINAVENVAEAADGAYYTLSGQRTMKPVKGMYIHNGKKYIAK